MTRLLTSILLLMRISAFSQVQPYQPMLEAGKTWDTFWGETGGIVPYTNGFRYLIEGSGTFLGQLYQEVWNVQFIADPNLPYFPPFVLGAKVPHGVIREDTIARRIYFRRFQFDWSLGEEQLIYDFSLSVGDSIQMAYGTTGPWFVLDSIGVVIIQNGEARRQFYFHNIEEPLETTFYIEGVGGKNGFATPLITPFEFVIDLVCVKRQQEVLYSAGLYDSPCGFTSATHAPVLEKVKISPNPVSDAFSLEIQPGLFKWLKLFDASGRLVGVWELETNDSNLQIPVQNIPDGTFWGLLIGEKQLGNFRGVKMK